MTFFRSILTLFRFNKRNWKAVFLCVFAATIFWFFNALNKDYSTNINFPVEFEFNRNSFIPIHSLPGAVRINVSGLGWDLFRRSVGFNTNPLSIQLDRPAEVKKIDSNVLEKMFASQLEGLELNYVLTDTLYVDIDPRVTRKVGVRIDSIEKYIKPEFGLAGPVIITPDSLDAVGPKGLVENLPPIISIPLNDRSIDEPYQDEVDVPELNPLLTLSPGSVVVRFDVAPYVIVEDTILLRVTGVPNQAYTRIELPTIRGMFKMLESRQESFKLDSIVAELDLGNIGPGRSRLYPKITGLPPDVQLMRLDSVTIEF